MLDITIMNRKLIFFLLILVAWLVMTGSEILSAQTPKGDEFTFIRIRWTDHGMRYGYGLITSAPPWAHDYPQAEHNFYNALKALTSIKVSEENKVLTFADEEIFEYSFIYACEIGYLTLSEAEVKNLREY